MTTGIYGFFDRETEECLYIGLSKNVEQRRKTHIRQLKSGTALKSFQNWYDQAGLGAENRVLFRILETCEEGILNEREIYWFNTLSPRFFGMKPSLEKTWKHSEEIARKAVEARSRISKLTLSREKVEELYYEKDMSAYDIAELWGVNTSTVFDRLKKFGIKTKHSLMVEEVGKRTYVCEVCEKSFRPKDARVATCSRECGRVSANKKNWGNPPSRKGASMSEETREKISNSLKGKNPPPKEASIKGGKTAAHKRWHLSRGIVSKSCELCSIQEEPNEGTSSGDVAEPG